MTSWGTAAVLFTGGVCEREPRHGHVRPQFSFRSCLIRILIHIFAAADANFSPAAEQPARAHARTATHTHTRSRVRQREMWSSIHKKKNLSPLLSHLPPQRPHSPLLPLLYSSVLFSPPLARPHARAHTVNDWKRPGKVTTVPTTTTTYTSIKSPAAERGRRRGVSHPCGNGELMRPRAQHTALTSLFFVCFVFCFYAPAEPPALRAGCVQQRQNKSLNTFIGFIQLQQCSP